MSCRAPKRDRRNAPAWSAASTATSRKESLTGIEDTTAALDNPARLSQHGAHAHRGDGIRWDRRILRREAGARGGGRHLRGAWRAPRRSPRGGPADQVLGGGGM